MNIAVITGASAGLGMKFFEHLKNNPEYDAFWLIARRKERLEALAEEKGIECWLSLEEKMKKLDEKYQKENEKSSGKLPDDFPDLPFGRNMAIPWESDKKNVIIKPFFNYLFIALQHSVLYR